MGFPGGLAVKNLPYDAEDTGLIPVQEDSTDTKQLSQCATTTEPLLWSPRAATTEAQVPLAPMRH